MTTSRQPASKLQKVCVAMEDDRVRSPEFGCTGQRRMDGATQNLNFITTQLGIWGSTESVGDKIK
jgi:hypothetical protein